MKDTISFGTDGIRGRADLYPFTPQALFYLGCAFAYWAQEKNQTSSPKILICGDTRISFNRIKNDLITGLSKFPVTILDAGVLPTPALCQLMMHDKSIDAGLVISASHNPYVDNGIKFFGKDNCKLNAQEEARVIALYEEFSAHREHIGDSDVAQIYGWHTAASTYQDLVVSHFPKNFLEGLTVVLDCSHGATSAVGPAIFKALNARVITLNDQPNGFNINDRCGALHPEYLAGEVVRWGADIGFAFDGDGDRVIAVNKYGHIKDGDDILYQLLALPEYVQERAVVGTVMTNQALECALEAQSRALVRAAVGDKYVFASLEHEQLLLGGENSGHIILKNYLSTCDAIFTSLMVLMSLMHQKNWDFITFEKFPQVLINVPVAQKRDLAAYPFQDIIQEYEQLLEHGRVLVRYSGTENLLRVMTEAPNHDYARQIAQVLAVKLQQALNLDI